MAFTKEMWENQRQTLISNNTNNLFWKPTKDGKYLLRYFVSPNDPNPQPFIVLFTHWVPTGDKTKPILCTQLSEVGEKKPCPICAKRQELFKTQVVENVELAKRIGPVQTRVQWGFVKEPSDEGFQLDPKLIALPKTVAKQLVDAVTIYEDEIEDIHSLDEGKVVVLRRDTEGQFPKYTVTISNKVFPLNKEPFLEKVKGTKAPLEAITLPSEEDIEVAISALNVYLTDGTIDLEVEDTPNAMPLRDEMKGEGTNLLGFMEDLNI